MVYVKEMTQKQRNEIIKVLEADGFTKISDSDQKIRFSHKDRSFEIISTEYLDSDLGIRMDFDVEKFLKERYQEKTRHSISFSEALKKYQSVEEALNYLEWEIAKVHDLQGPNTEWKAEPYAEALIEVNIGQHVHIIVNETVYMGELKPLLDVGSVGIEEALSGKEILPFLAKMNQN